jgi:hypothetical protein
MTVADASRDDDSRALAYAVAASLGVGVMAVAGVIVDNRGEAAPAEAWRALAALAAVSLAGPALLAALGGSFKYLAWAFPAALFCAFKFPGFVAFAEAAGLRGDAASLGGLVALALAVAAAVQIYKRRGAPLVALTAAIAAAAAGASVAAAAAAEFGGRGSYEAVVARLTRPPALPQPDAADLPDVIYIVPDRYGSLENLAEEFGVDGRAFAAALRARGFYVAPDAQANYAKTFQSLASTLNMTPLDDLVAAVGPDAATRAPTYRMIEDSAAARALQSLGYRYIHLGSWWEGTQTNRNADENYNGLDTIWSSLNEFERALLRTTPAGEAATYGGFVDRAECRRLQSQLDFLKRARARHDGPVFVFAHLTMPHDPITMDRTGKCVRHLYYPASRISWSAYRAAYRDYVGHLNDELLAIVDANRAAAKPRGLVFVIQADEGPYPKRLHEKGSMNMFAFSEEEMRMKFGIINALYWDAERYGAPRLTRTPVNNWRIILSAISGADLPLIDDERSHLFRDEGRPYLMRDVTGVLRDPP